MRWLAGTRKAPGLVTYEPAGAAHWKKGDQMRYKATFIAGFAVGFLAGARSGRGTYDKIVRAGQKVAGNPKVQQATSAAQSKAAEVAKTAAAKAPDYAKNAAKTAQEQVSQVPRYVSTAKEAAQSKLPPRLGGTSDAGDSGPAADGTVTGGPAGHVDLDGNLVYPAEGSPSVNGTLRHYNPEAS